MSIVVAGELSANLRYLQYSGFQQTAEKCNICGHLIMEMVEYLTICFIMQRLNALVSRFYTRWESLITLDASAVAFATNVLTVFRLRSMSTTRFTV